MDKLTLSSISAKQIVGRILTNKLCCAESSTSISEVLEEAGKQMMCLNLPRTLKEILKDMTIPIYYEIFYYSCYWSMFGIKLFFNYVSELSFTVEGSVDFKQSTCNIILNKQLDIKTRSILACHFCLEEEVLAIWKSHPDMLRESAESPSVANWLKFLEETGEFSEPFLWNNKELLETAFLSAVNDLNLIAAEYFYKKIRVHPNKKVSILEIAVASLPLEDSLSDFYLIFKLRMQKYLMTELVEANKLVLEWKTKFCERKIKINERLKKIQERLAVMAKKNPMWKDKHNLFETKYNRKLKKWEMFKIKQDKKKNKESFKEKGRVLMKECDIHMFDEEAEILFNEYDIVMREDDKINKEMELFENITN